MNFQSPLEKFFNVILDYVFLKVFGCKCYPYLHLFNDHKLQFISSPYIFIGFNPRHKGYKCLHINGKLYISLYVNFDETWFPFASLMSSSLSVQQKLVIILPIMQTPFDSFPTQFS